VRFIVADDDLWTTRPDLTVKSGGRFEKPEVIVQEALDGSVVESDGAGVRLIGVEFNNGALSN
jgi:hypothetical protein